MEKRRKKLKKSCHSYSICKIDREVKPDMYILRNSIQFESTMYLCNCVLQSMIELKCKCEQVQKMANLVTPSIDQFRVTKNMILLGIENLLTAPQPKHTQNLDKQKKIDIKLNQSQHHSFLENSIHTYFLCLFTMFVVVLQYQFTGATCPIKLYIMEIRVVDFLNGGCKIRMSFS